MQVCVEHDDGEGQQEHGVRGAERLGLVRVALTVALSERLHQTLDLLSLTLGAADTNIQLSTIQTMAVRFGTKVDQNGTKLDKSGTFEDHFSVHFDAPY